MGVSITLLIAFLKISSYSSSLREWTGRGGLLVLLFVYKQGIHLIYIHVSLYSSFNFPTVFFKEQYIYMTQFRKPIPELKHSLNHLLSFLEKFQPLEHAFVLKRLCFCPFPHVLYVGNFGSLVHLALCLLLLS